MQPRGDHFAPRIRSARTASCGLRTADCGLSTSKAYFVSFGTPDSDTIPCERRDRGREPSLPFLSCTVLYCVLVVSYVPNSEMPQHPSNRQPTVCRRPPQKSLCTSKPVKCTINIPSRYTPSLLPPSSLFQLVPTCSKSQSQISILVLHLFPWSDSSWLREQGW